MTFAAVLATVELVTANKSSRRASKRESKTKHTQTYIYIRPKQSWSDGDLMAPGGKKKEQYRSIATPYRNSAPPLPRIFSQQLSRLELGASETPVEQACV